MSALLRLRLLYLGMQADDNIVFNENRRQRRRSLRRQRLDADDAFTLSDRQFIKTYRLPKGIVRSLIRQLRPHIRQERRRDALDASSKVLIALAFYASGSYQTLVGQSRPHSVSQSSVSRAVREVTEALNAIFPDHVRFPMTREAREKIRRRFYSKFSIPGVVGCIDGTHVAIIKPAEQEELYYCRKGYHSINVMIICDADLNILCVDASRPGRTHDSVVWRDHPLNRHLDEVSETETNFLLGDSGYALRKTLLTPILNTLPGSPENFYYNAHVRTRNVVERTIGVLKARFRCLLVARQLHYSPEMAAKIINACCVLHNIANGANLGVPELSEREREEELRMHVQCTHEENLLQNANAAVATNLEPRPRSTQNTPLSLGRAVQAHLVLNLWQNRN